MSINFLSIFSELNCFAYAQIHVRVAYLFLIHLTEPLIKNILIEIRRREIRNLLSLKLAQNEIYAKTKQTGYLFFQKNFKEQYKKQLAGQVVNIYSGKFV